MRTPRLDGHEAARVAEAIEAAEYATSGELFVVVAARADDYRLVPILWAAAAALIAVWPLHLLTPLSTNMVLALQAALFVVVVLALSPLAVRTALAPPWLAQDEVERAAREQFLSHGIHLTDARTGVLIFVALAERRVEIIADDGIAARVDQAEWDAIAAEVVTDAREGQLVSGLLTAIDHSGRLLAAHFPAGSDNRNELPNALIQI
jgi:putative membrane protein